MFSPIIEEEIIIEEEEVEQEDDEKTDTHSTHYWYLVDTLNFSREWVDFAYTLYKNEPTKQEVEKTFQNYPHQLIGIPLKTTSPLLTGPEVVDKEQWGCVKPWGEKGFSSQQYMQSCQQGVASLYEYTGPENGAVRIVPGYLPHPQQKIPTTNATSCRRRCRVPYSTLDTEIEKSDEESTL